MSVQDKSNPSPLLDQEQIQMLIEAGSPESVDLFREILDLFEDESRQKLEDLSHSVGSKDFEAMGRSAHALAGSSANIGGKEVWKKAKVIEDLCKTGKGEEAALLIPELLSTYQQTITALKAYSAGLD